MDLLFKFIIHFHVNDINVDSMVPVWITQYKLIMRVVQHNRWLFL